MSETERTKDPKTWHAAAVMWLLTVAMTWPFFYYWGHTTGYAKCDAELAATIDEETADALATIAAAHEKGIAEVIAAGEEAYGKVKAAQDKVEAETARLEDMVRRTVLTPPKWEGKAD